MLKMWKYTDLHPTSNSGNDIHVEDNMENHFDFNNTDDSRYYHIIFTQQII